VQAADRDLVETWLRIDDDGAWILTGKVELGQGIHEALSMLVAEELDLPFDRVHVAPVDTAVSRDEGLTAGSRSVQETGRTLRAVAATARRALVAAAGRRLSCPVDELTVRDGRVSGRGREVAFADLARDGALATPVDPAAPTKAPGDRRLLGTSPVRRDILPRITGAPTFIGDLDLPGMLHGRVVRPPGPGARLGSMDAEALRRNPGVVSVVRDGDFLGIVAEREDTAVAALSRATRFVEWEPGPPLPSVDDPRYLLGAEAEEIVVEDRGGSEPRAVPARSLRAEYSRPHVAHGAVGPSCAIARFDADGLMVWAHSQGIFRLRHELALVLGLDESAVRVRHVEGAGCYGHNGADDVALDAALLARANPGRPVRVQWMRDDEFAWEPYGPAMLIRLTADVDANGQILDWRHELWGHGHDSRPGRAGMPADTSALLAARHLSQPFLVPRPRAPRAATSGGQRNAVPYYSVPRLRVVDHYVADAPLRVSSLRSLGAHANVFAIESFMDEIAAATGLEPLELRLRHLEDPRAREVLTTVAAMAGPAPRTEGELLRGRGLGFARYKNQAAYAAVMVDVELGTSIRVRRAWAAIDAGMVVSRSGLLNQAEGGIVQAVSWTLLEAIRTESAGIASRDWDTYPALRFPDVPEVEVRLIDRPDEPPVGAGEAFAGPTSAAIANAIANASGVRLRDLPLTRDRFVAALG